MDVGAEGALMLPLHPSIGERFEARFRVWEWDGDKWRRYKKPPPPLIEPLVTPPLVTPSYTNIWPSDPIVGEQVVGPSGQKWQWDGEKWVGVAWTAQIIEGPPGPQGPPGQWTQITRADFDQLDPPDPNTLYVIVG